MPPQALMRPACQASTAKAEGVFAGTKWRSRSTGEIRRSPEPGELGEADIAQLARAEAEVNKTKET